MEPVSQTTTTVITDKRVFKTTAPNGDVYSTTVTTKTHETNVATPIRRLDPAEPPRRHLRTTICTTLRHRQHRVAPYPGARPERVSSGADSTTVTREAIVPGGGE